MKKSCPAGLMQENVLKKSGNLYSKLRRNPASMIGETLIKPHALEMTELVCGVWSCGFVK